MSASRNEVEDSPEPVTPQEWTALGVALPRDMKLRLVRRARERGLKPSPYARMLLIAAMASEDRAA